MSYIPRVGHGIITSILIIGCLLIGAKYKDYQTVWNAGAFIFAVITAVVMYLLILQGLDQHTETITRFIVEFNKADDESRVAVAFAFPSLRYRMKKGRVRELFEDTNVPMSVFRQFLADSNSKYIAPLRDWNTRERPRWAWIEIKEYLEDAGYIVADSASGSHSWLWKGSAYRHLMSYWMSGRRIVDLDKVRL